MADNVIKLGLDISNVLSNYKKLVGELQKSGANPKIITDLTKGFSSVEKKLSELNAEASLGFSDSRAVETYQKKVAAVTTDIKILASEMENLAGNSENFPTSPFKQAQKEITKLTADLENLKKQTSSSLGKNLENLGFSKTQIANLQASVTSEKALTKALREERKARAEASAEAKAALNAARPDANRKFVSKHSNAIDDVASSINVSGMSKGLEAAGSSVQEFQNSISETISEGLAKGLSGDTIYSRIQDLAESFGEEVELSFRDVDLSPLAQSLGSHIEEFFPELSAKEVQKMQSASLPVLRDTYAVTSTPEGKAYTQAAQNYQQIGQNERLNPAAKATIEEYAAGLQQAKEIETQLINTETNLSNVQKQDEQERKQVVNGIKEATKALDDEKAKHDEATTATYSSISANEKLEASFDNISQHIKDFLSIGSAISIVKNIVQDTFNTVKQLDKSFSSIALVTNQTVEGLWSTYGQYADMATQLGQSTDSVIQASALFYQQGLDTNEALSLTEDTMKLATLAGNDYATATQEMTSALRGFKMEMDEGSHVADVYSELAAHAAATVDDIALAMSRTASIGA